MVAPPSLFESFVGRFSRWFATRVMRRQAVLRDRGSSHLGRTERSIPSWLLAWMPNVSGGYIEEAIPDPIPNSEVKLFGADGTAWGICVGE